MSKIVVVSLYKIDKPAEAVSIVRFVAKTYGMGVCFDTPVNEPFLQEYACPDLLFTISDTEETENCELFFLPDGWTINGAENPVPFVQRMKILQQFAYRLSNICERLEILIGDSGMDLDDFALCEIAAKDIPSVMVNTYCGVFDCQAVRLVVQQ